MPSDSSNPFTSSPSGMLVVLNTSTRSAAGSMDFRGDMGMSVRYRIMGRLFGTDGVRGIANRELSAELAFRLGRAAVTALAETGVTRPHIAVGRDTRASGEFLEAALTSGICSAGGDAILLGVCTTPSVAFLTTDLGAEAGAVISASHNPAEYNGIKFFGANGYKVPDNAEDEIEAVVRSDRAERPVGRDLGRVVPASEARERYLTHLEFL